MARAQRQPAVELLMHTDRGSQYGADSARQGLSQYGREPSMSRTGTWWGNAVAESVFHTCKTELISLEDCATHEQAPTAVCAYSDVSYNRQCCHAAHGALAPLVYAQALHTHEPLCPDKR
jgi:transposase InsO family protein